MPLMNFIKKEPISKGWSCDQKFCVTAQDNTKYLLRITPFEKSAERSDMFRMQQKVASLDIPMCRPVEMGAKWGSARMAFIFCRRG